MAAAPRPLILVVDDDPDLRALVQRYLAKAGYDVATAENAPEAHKRLRERVPDLIVSDINMPGMTGDELVFALKVDPAFKKVPVVYLTGLEPDAKLAKRTLGLPLLSKPVVEKDLLLIVESQLPRKKPA